MTSTYDRDGFEVTLSDVVGPSCDDCEGSGVCENCGGPGDIVTPVRRDIKTCPECKGTGECAGCDGRGYLT